MRRSNHTAILLVALLVFLALPGCSLFDKGDDGGIEVIDPVPPIDTPLDCSTNNNAAVQVFVYSPPGPSNANNNLRVSILNQLSNSCYMTSNQPNYTDFPSQAASGVITIGYASGQQAVGTQVLNQAQNAANGSGVSFQIFEHLPVSQNHVVVYLNF